MESNKLKKKNKKKYNNHGILNLTNYCDTKLYICHNVCYNCVDQIFCHRQLILRELF